MADDKTPSNWKSFQDRYATDADFKKSVDARRATADTARKQDALTDSLAMVRGARDAKQKLY